MILSQSAAKHLFTIFIPILHLYLHCRILNAFLREIITNSQNIILNLCKKIFPSIKVKHGFSKHAYNELTLSAK